MLPQNLVHPTPTLEKMEEKNTTPGRGGESRFEQLQCSSQCKRTLREQLQVSVKEERVSCSSGSHLHTSLVTFGRLGEG